jgi:hypothetical protein
MYAAVVKQHKIEKLFSIFDFCIKKQTMSTINIFIPRILAGISEDSIKLTFYEMNIGIVTYIDLHTRFNDLNYKYSFAFITIQLFNTFIADTLVQKMNTQGRAQIPYDDRNYWEIKYYIPKENRGCNPDAKEWNPSPQIPIPSPQETAEIKEPQPEWLNDNRDDWKFHDQEQHESKFMKFFGQPQTNESITQLCSDLLKTPEQRDREKEFDDLQIEINKTVFSQRVVSW